MEKNGVIACILIAELVIFVSHYRAYIYYLGLKNIIIIILETSSTLCAPTGPAASSYTPPSLPSPTNQTTTDTVAAPIKHIEKGMLVGGLHGN